MKTGKDFLLQQQDSFASLSEISSGRAASGASADDHHVIGIVLHLNIVNPTEPRRKDEVSELEIGLD